MSYFLYVPPADMRKGFDGLSGLVKSQLNRDPLDGSVYIFINRRRDRVKLLLWDRNGMILFYKRLEKGTFEIPVEQTLSGGVTLKWEVLIMMLEGYSLQGIKQRKRYKKEPVKLGKSIHYNDL
jgi:transposase